jgi:hypothetical protein
MFEHLLELSDNICIDFMTCNQQDKGNQFFSGDISKESKDEDYATDQWMLGSESEVCFDGSL